MVHIDDRLDAIQSLIEGGAYFMPNKVGQYGKTTTLDLLADRPAVLMIDEADQARA